MNINVSIRKVPVTSETSQENAFREHGFKAIDVDGGCAIIEYEGTDTAVIVPDTICGKSVVAIGDGSYKHYPFSTYVFGDIERDRKGTNSFTSIMIPASVDFIEQQAFVFCYPEAIHVHEDNQMYTSVDGVLFDKEMQNLIRYPMSKVEKTYIVPDGVKDIKGNFTTGRISLFNDGLHRGT